MGAFVAGIAAIAISFLLEYPLARLLGSGENFYGTLVMSALMAPIVEETSKALSAIYIAKRVHPDVGFRTGLTFGVIETILYAVSFAENTAEASALIALRMAVSVPLHVACTSMFLYGLYLYKRGRPNRLNRIIAAYLVHGLFNFSAVTARSLNRFSLVNMSVREKLARFLETFTENVPVEFAALIHIPSKTVVTFTIAAGITPGYLEANADKFENLVKLVEELGFENVLGEVEGTVIRGSSGYVVVSRLSENVLLVCGGSDASALGITLLKIIELKELIRRRSERFLPRRIIGNAETARNASSDL